MNCDKCVYGQFPKISPTPIRQCNIAIVGEAPGNTEIAFKTPFIGPSGELLNDTLKLAGLPDREDIFITNALMCRPIKDKAVKKEAIIQCQERLIEELKQVNPKMILSLGNVATHSLTNNFSLKISHINGKVLSSPYLNGTKIVPIFHPANVLRNPGNQPPFNAAFIYSKYILDGGKPKKPGRMYYTILEDDQTLIDTLKYIAKNYKGHIMGADIETLLLSPYQGKTLYIGIAFESDVVVMFTWEKLHLPEVKEFFTNTDLQFGWQNGQFDTCFFNAIGIPARVDHDSNHLHYCTNEHEGRHDLDTLAMRILGADLYSHIMKPYITQMDKAPRYLWAPYLAKDCAYCKQIIENLLPVVEKDARLKKLYYRIMIPGANFLREVQWNGFHINKDYCLKYKKVLEAEISLLNKELNRQFQPYWDPAQYRIDTKAMATPKIFNPASNKQLAWMVYDKLKLRPGILKATNNGKSVDKDVIASLRGQHDAVDTLLTCRGKQKILSTYIIGVLDRLDPDSRIRSQFWLTRTVTGRTSSKEPNLQNISRNKTVKNIFGSPKDRILIEADYKALELRVLAHMSKDQFFTDVFKAGRDPHDEMSIEMFGKDFTEDERFKVKGLNFGIAYGRGAKSVAEEFNISIWEAKYLIREWFERTAGAKHFMEKCEEYLVAGKTFLTIFGRKRRFGSVARYAKNSKMLEHMKREARNFPIQSTAADLTLLAAMAIHKVLPKNCMIVNLVHDSIIIEAPNVKTVVMPLLQMMKNTMEQIPQKELHPQFEFPAEFSIGKSWGNMKPIEV